MTSKGCTGCRRFTFTDYRLCSCVPVPQKYSAVRATGSDVAIGCNVTFASWQTRHYTIVTEDNLNYLGWKNNIAIESLFIVKLKTEQHRVKILRALPVSVEKTRKLLSQNPQATKNLLSTVVTKQLLRIFNFWLKLSPKCLRRAGFELFAVWAVKILSCIYSLMGELNLRSCFAKYVCHLHRTGSIERGWLMAWAWGVSA